MISWVAADVVMCIEVALYSLFPVLVLSSCGGMRKLCTVVVSTDRCDDAFVPLCNNCATKVDLHVH